MKPIFLAAILVLSLAAVALPATAETHYCNAQPRPIDLKPSLDASCVACLVESVISDGADTCEFVY